jgi:hypothetical protein
MKYLKLYEDYEDSIEDFENLKKGDILISKYDIYIKYPKGFQVNYMSPILSLFGDKLFVTKGRTKKVKIVDNSGRNSSGPIYLSGYNCPISIEKIQKYFTIKNGEILKSTNKFNI